MDWLSRFLEIVPVSGHLDIRCLYAAPWRLTFETARPGEIPYHIIISGAATLEHPDSGSPKLLTAGDILLLPHGLAYTLHDGSGKRPHPAKQKLSLNLTISKNGGKGGGSTCFAATLSFRQHMIAFSKTIYLHD